MVCADGIGLLFVERPELGPVAVYGRNPAHRKKRKQPRLRRTVLSGLRLPEWPKAEIRIVLAARPERKHARLVIVELDELPAEARDRPGFVTLVIRAPIDALV